MLVNDERKVVLYTPFKNYSTSLHEYFGVDRRWWNYGGPQPFGSGMGAHTNAFDPRWESYDIWLPIRNPFARVVSMWGFNQSAGYQCSFDEFCRSRLNEPSLGPVTEIYRHTRTIHVERIESKLHSLGCGYGKFPHKNRGTLKRPKLTDEQIEQIVRVHESDFEAGRYPTTFTSEN